ncbi:MAG: 16S rRNA processing protein RimM [Geobacteraceae bacterium]|nr:16S rRNA processing protein RimM [Geobacteraceae bacterium]
MDSESLVLMGKVAGTHGIKGQLRVIPYSGMMDNLLACKSLILRDAKGKTERFELSSAVVHVKKLLITLKGYSDINQVLHFSGCEVFLDKDQLAEPEEGEFYWYDLIGMKVVTTDGADLGTLQSIIETGSNDVYVSVLDHKEFLIPAFTDTVSIDLAAKLITVTPFEGLFDL